MTQQMPATKALTLDIRPNISPKASIAKIDRQTPGDLPREVQWRTPAGHLHRDFRRFSRLQMDRRWTVPVCY